MTLATVHSPVDWPAVLHAMLLSLPLTGAVSTRGLVAMTSAQHAEGRQFDPGRVYALQYDRSTGKVLGQ